VDKLAKYRQLPALVRSSVHTSMCSCCPAFKGSHVHIRYESRVLYLHPAQGAFANDELLEPLAASAITSLGCTTPSHELAIAGHPYLSVNVRLRLYEQEHTIS
jgi:hypothetical protein